MRFPSETESLRRCAFAAPRRLVFASLTRCEALRQWLGPRGSVLRACAVDPRPEAGYRIALRDPDGSDHTVRGVFREVASPERLACTFAFERVSRTPVGGLLTITLREREGLTWLTSRATFGSRAARDALHGVGTEGVAVESGDRLTEFLALDQNPTAEDELFLARVLDAPRSLVFGAWTDPVRLAAWWGPPDATPLHASSALEPGGLHHFGHRAPDGGETWERFQYREIDRPARLVFLHGFADPTGDLVASPFAATWPRQVLATLTLFELGGRTLVTLRGRPFEATSAERAAFGRSRDDVRRRWTATFARLAAHLAAHPAGP